MSDLANVTERVAAIARRQQVEFERALAAMKTLVPEIPEDKLRSIMAVAFYAGVKAMLHEPILSV